MQNGYTALTRAIVFNQFEVAKQLCITRPALRKIGDNVSCTMITVFRFTEVIKSNYETTTVQATKCNFLNLIGTAGSFVFDIPWMLVTVR